VPPGQSAAVIQLSGGQEGISHSQSPVGLGVQTADTIVSSSHTLVGGMPVQFCSVHVALRVGKGQAISGHIFGDPGFLQVPLILHEGLAHEQTVPAGQSPCVMQPTVLQLGRSGQLTIALEPMHVPFLPQEGLAQ